MVSCSVQESNRGLFSCLYKTNANFLTHYDVESVVSHRQYNCHSTDGLDVYSDVDILLRHVPSDVVAGYIAVDIRPGGGCVPPPGGAKRKRGSISLRVPSRQDATTKKRNTQLLSIIHKRESTACGRLLTSSALRDRLFCIHSDRDLFNDHRDSTDKRTLFHMNERVRKFTKMSCGATPTSVRLEPEQS